VCSSDLDIEAESAGSRNLLGARIHPHHLAPELDEAPGQGSVSAAEIEDPLTSSWTEECDHGITQIRDETSVMSVLLGIPVLAAHGIQKNLKSDLSLSL
jgi:hypothetical protein